MNTTVAAVLLCLAVAASAKSLSGESTLLTKGQAHLRKKRDAAENKTNGYEKFLNSLGQINMDIDSVDLSENLRCAACLIECVEIRKTLSYFLCRNCLESCANKTDAFMHFFSSHECKVIQKGNDHDGDTMPDSASTNDGSPPSTRPFHGTTQPAAADSSNRDGSASSNTDYLDKYLEINYFSKECSVRKQDYVKAKNELNECRVELGNLNAGWLPSEWEPPSHNNDEGDNTHSSAIKPDTIQQDTEKSAIPSRATPTEKSITRGPTTTTSGDVDPEMKTEFTKEQLEEIVGKYQSMFVTKQEYEELSSFPWEEMEEREEGMQVPSVALIKSYVNRKRHERRQKEIRERRTAACPITYQFERVKKALHRLGNLSVELLQTEDYSQVFVVAKCAQSDPVIKELPDARCRPVVVQRTAVIVVKKENSDGIKNCSSYGNGKYICRDWINVTGACALYL